MVKADHSIAQEKYLRSSLALTMYDRVCLIRGELPTVILSPNSVKLAMLGLKMTVVTSPGLRQILVYTVRAKDDRRYFSWAQADPSLHC